MPPSIAIIKFNGGNGALLCNGCHTILKTGINHENIVHTCPECNLRLLKNVPITDLHVGTRVKQLDSDTLGTIYEISPERDSEDKPNHRIVIEWDEGKQKSMRWHTQLDVIMKEREDEDE